MPSFVPHIIFGRKLLEVFDCREILFNKRMFLAGCLLPDLSTCNQKTHFHVRFDEHDGEVNNSENDHAGYFHIPDLESAARYYRQLSDPSCRAGVNAHLFLDCYFTEHFLAKKFTIKDEQVIGPEISMPVEKFFSPEGLYGAYDYLNDEFYVRGFLSWEWLKENIPCPVPLASHMPLLNDYRNPKLKNWFRFLQDHSLRITGPDSFFYQKIITVDEMLDCMHDASRAYLKADYGLRLNYLSDGELTRLSPLLIIPGNPEYQIHYATLRQCMIEIILQNPNQNAQNEKTIRDFTKSIAVFYWNYCQRQTEKKHGYAPKFFRTVLINGRELIGCKYGDGHHLLSEIYQGFLEKIDNAVYILSHDERFPYWVAEKQIAVVEETIASLIIANIDLYRLVMKVIITNKD